MNPVAQTREKQNVVCCLPMEVKVREFDAIILMAVHFLLRGFPCVMGRKREVRRYINEHNGPFVLLSKDVFYPRWLHRRLAETNSILAVLDAEGGFFDPGMVKLGRRTDPKLLQFVDLYLAWGEEQRRYIMKYRPEYPSERIHVVGHPRLDLCQPRFAHIFRARREAHAGITPGYFLANASFSKANSFMGDHMLRYKAMYREVVSKEILNFEAMRKQIEYKTRALNHFCTAVRALSERFPSQPIVIRPHPSGRGKTYEEMFADRPNVHVILEGVVQQWIVDAGLVLHYDCSSGMEAMLSGKPTISYCPQADRELQNWVVHDASYRIQSLEELLETVERYIVQDYRPQHFAERYDLDLVSKWLANTDFCSAERLAACIESTVAAWGTDQKAETVSKFERGELEDRSHRPRESLPAIAVRRLRRIMGRLGLDPRAREADDLKRRKAAFREHKFAGIARDEVEERLHAFGRVEGLNEDINIESVGESTYLLRPAPKTG